jgi:hypothetical protein
MWVNKSSVHSIELAGIDRETNAKVESYLTYQLRRKGFHRRGHLAERLEIAIQLWNFEICRVGRAPEDERERRRLADYVLYRAIRELKPCAAHSLESCFASAVAVEQFEADAISERGRVIRDRIEALPVSERLLVKLKIAAVFYPEIPDGRPRWRDDEAKFLRRQHPRRTMNDLNRSFREHLTQGRLGYRGRVSSVVIAWVVGLSSASAVDSAYFRIAERLRSESSPQALLWYWPRGMGSLKKVRSRGRFAQLARNSVIFLWHDASASRKCLCNDRSTRRSRVYEDQPARKRTKLFLL